MSVKSIIDTLICERAPWLSADNRPIRCIDRALKFALGYDKTLSLVHTLSPMSGADILKRTSADIAQDVRVEGLHNIPRSGAALIVAIIPPELPTRLFCSRHFLPNGQICIFLQIAMFCAFSHNLAPILRRSNGEKTNAAQPSRAKPWNMQKLRSLKAGLA